MPASGIAARNGLNEGAEDGPDAVWAAGLNEGAEDGPDAAGAAVLNEGGETAVRKSSMPPRYGSAQSGGSCGTSYVDNGTAGRGQRRAMPRISRPWPSRRPAPTRQVP